MNVRLRPLAAADCDAVRDWRNRPHVAAMMYTDHEISAGEHATWFAAALIDQTKRYYIVETLEDGGWTGAGLAGFTHIEEQSASWAFYLADAETRGRGLGAQTEFLMLGKAFDELGLHRLRCEVLAINARVVALHESFGFRRIALLAGRVVKNGAPHDVVALEMKREDWAFARGMAEHRLNGRAEHAAKSA
ncbi:MAG TPA: UDP-4-amino-4,6-dideoxy-N-acetyl-beta-L-altrosamine N-acetyltransferase [Caulobacterales bacterium]|jgi:UDP-4-amino-4,6-dideoxy-N-acetyl-beta-L-altrosamine N-acetyltransferase|nr:UDP-4-amino-4,6-dideoxy-N-acetyl-beta-L-altrosamine N-acetyltransferase [Caulobacterales bacterium]